MISVVIPTLWKYTPFLDFVSNIVQIGVVGEVIIFNNNQAATPIHEVLSHSKVKLINCNENIFVNPAWNLGVQLSAYDKVCILNDDVIVDLKMFFKVDEFLTKDMGLVGLCPGRPEFNQPLITNGQVEFVPWTGQHTFGFGSLFCLHKDNWNRIPDGLDIYYGDNWAFDTQLRMGRTNWLITNCFYYSPWAASTSKLENANEWLSRESPIYHQAVEQVNNGTIILH